MWRSVNLALGRYFERERPKRDIGTRGDKRRFVDLLRAPTEDDDDDAYEPSYEPY